MTISILQSVSGGIDTAENTTNRGVAFTTNLSTGSWLVCCFSVRDSDPGNLSVSDSAGNVWAKRRDTYSDRGASIWVAPVMAGVGTKPTVTVSKGGVTCGVGMSLYELANVTSIGGSPFDATDGVAQGVSSGPAQCTTGSSNYTNDLVLAVIGVEQAAYVTCTPLSGYTDTGVGSTNTAIALQHRVITKQTTSAATQTAGWTLNAASHWSVAAVIFRGSTTAPTITGTDTLTPAYLGSLTINGVNFGASQGTGGVTIGGVAQTVSSWSDTAIVINSVARGTLAYGVTENVQVTINGGTTSNTYALTGITPQAGWSVVTIGTPNGTSANRITAAGDIASTDQLAWNNLSSTVTVFTDGTFVEYGQSSFGVEDWSSGNGWGTTGTQTINQSAGGPTVASMGMFGF